METGGMVAPKTGAYVKKDFNKIALIDADRYKHVVPYNIWKALQDGEKHDDDLVKRLIHEKLEEDIFSKFNAKAYVFCFSAPSKDVFRNYISQEKLYKGNRMNRPDHYSYDEKFKDMGKVYDYIAARYPTLIEKDLEADDLLSMLQQGEDTFIFSHDKDLNQVVGYHYNMDIGQLVYTDEDDAMSMLICQILQGDTTDNIPGLPGFGVKSVEKFCEECKGKTHEHMIMMAIQKFTEKHGSLHGMDMFVEMWNLVSMKLNRGNYLKERYTRSFAMIEPLLNYKNG